MNARCRAVLALPLLLLLCVSGWAPASPTTSTPVSPPRLRLDDSARPTRYAADLTVDPAAVSFNGTIDIDVELRRETTLLWLNATDLTIRDARFQVEGRSLPARTVAGNEDIVGFSVDRPIGPGAARLHVAYTGKISDTERGGLFKRKDGDTWYAFTQFAPSDARRAFPCFDEPAFKVPWQVTLHVPQDQGAFSNTPVLSQTEEPGGRKAMRFAETPPLPSYLVAFAVGPFEIIEAGKAGRKRTPVRIIAPRGRLSETQYAAEISAEILTRVERYFGIPYPYEKLDLVAVPQFGFSAMENPGLIALHDTIILGRPKAQTIQQKRGYVDACTHEIAHQWFGDLVTMEWWDDLWLNEAFANWLATKVIDAWKPEWELRLARLRRRSFVMSNDSLVSARKIRQPIESKDDVENAFDTITYDKGEAVLEMFESWMGEETFRKGIQRYLDRHAWGSATSAEFLAALGGEAGADIAAAFSTFVDQTGVPVVTVTLHCEPGSPPRVTLEQDRYRPVGAAGSSAQLWHIPVCIEYGDNTTQGRDCTLLTQRTAEIRLSSASDCPRWVLANPRASGYYQVRYQGGLLSRLLDTNRSLASSDRLVLTGEIRALAASGELPAGEALALLPRLLESANRHVIAGTVQIASAVRSLVPEELRPNYARFIRKTYGRQARALGWIRRNGDDDETQLLRSSLVGFVAGVGEDPALTAEAGRLARRWLEDRRALDPDIAFPVLTVAVRNGDRALFERIHTEARKTQDPRERAQLLVAMAGFRDPEIHQTALSLILTDEFNPRESRVLLGGADPKSRVQSYEFLKQNFDRLVAKLPTDEVPYLVTFASGFNDAERLADVESFFGERMSRFTGAPRILAQTLEQIRLNIALKEAQSPSLAAFLKKQ